jgi:hypothetical protein
MADYIDNCRTDHFVRWRRCRTAPGHARTIWDTGSGEFVYVISGEVVLVSDAAKVLRADESVSGPRTRSRDEALRRDFGISASRQKHELKKLLCLSRGPNAN